MERRVHEYAENVIGTVEPTSRVMVIVETELLSCCFDVSMLTQTKSEWNGQWNGVVDGRDVMADSRKREKVELQRRQKRRRTNR
jgi:hypothetical protein